jgi:heme-degrading monooxygenase HmoA
MIVEHALIDVRPELADGFPAAVEAARPVIGAADGFVSLELRRGIESPARFLLLVTWATLEDHTVGFRQSPAFAEWRAVVGPFFADPPAVYHYTAPLVTG